jgi:hypothetical protein
MLITPFRVRLADKDTGYKKGYVGTVIGEDVVQGPDGKGHKVYLVIWNKVDEETGIEAVGDQPTPASHLPQELRSHVDEEGWESDDDDYDEDEDEPSRQASDESTPVVTM